MAATHILPNNITDGVTDGVPNRLPNVVTHSISNIISDGVPNNVPDILSIKRTDQFANVLPNVMPNCQSYCPSNTRMHTWQVPEQPWTVRAVFSRNLQYRIQRRLLHSMCERALCRSGIDGVHCMPSWQVPPVCGQHMSLVRVW
jgi:hypothetical protein